MGQYGTELRVGIRSDITSVVYDTGQVRITHPDRRIPGHTRVIGSSIIVQILHDVYIHIPVVIPGIFLYLGIVSATVTESRVPIMKGNTGRRISVRIFFCQTKCYFQGTFKRIPLRMQLLPVSLQSPIILIGFHQSIPDKIDSYFCPVVILCTKNMEYDRYYIFKIVRRGCHPNRFCTRFQRTGLQILRFFSCSDLIYFRGSTI